MIYKLYYIEDNTNTKLVRDIDDIHENNVWAVSGLWGTAITVVLSTDDQPADAADYTEVTQ